MIYVSKIFFDLRERVIKMKKMNEKSIDFDRSNMKVISFKKNIDIICCDFFV